MSHCLSRRFFVSVAVLLCSAMAVSGIALAQERNPEDEERPAVAYNVVEIEIPECSVSLYIPVLAVGQNFARYRINTILDYEIRNYADMLVREAIYEFTTLTEAGASPKPNPWVVAVDSGVGFVNDTVVSFFVVYGQYTGGAQGMYFGAGYTFDILYGEKIYLMDLFTSLEYIEIINRFIEGVIAENPTGYYEGEDGFVGIGANQAYYLEEGYLIISFNPYEIAPFAVGMPAFEIPWSEFEGILSEYGLAVAEAYL